MAKLDELIREIRTELGTEFIATDIVGNDGMSIAGESSNPDFNSDAAGARFALVMKLGAKVSGKLGFGGLEENLVTTNKLFIISRYLGDQSYYWGVAVDNEAVLGSVRMLMNEYADQLWEAIPR